MPIYSADLIKYLPPPGSFKTRSRRVLSESSLDNWKVRLREHLNLTSSPSLASQLESRRWLKSLRDLVGILVTLEGPEEPPGGVKGGVSSTRWKGSSLLGTLVELPIASSSLSRSNHVTLDSCRNWPPAKPSTASSQGGKMYHCVKFLSQPTIDTRRTLGSRGGLPARHYTSTGIGSRLSGSL